MEIRHKLLSEWQKRLPDLDNAWTHWWLEGEGYCIDVIPYKRMSDAIEAIKNNFQRFSSIFAYRAKIGGDGNFIKQNKHRYEIANYKNDSKI